MMLEGSHLKKKLLIIVMILTAAAATGMTSASLPRRLTAPAAESANRANAVPAAQSASEKSARKSVYTVIVAGLDDASGNTDTIIVLRVDSGKKTVDAVSIPRDTYVNLPWSVRKINCVYTGTKNSGGDGIEGLRAAVCSLVGFMPDCCAVVDIDTVISAIDVMGGVYFNVPFDMDYDDAEQGLSIHIPAGYQHLSGEQCLQLCRYRKDYVNGDIDRISLQHSFLKAAAKQFITLGSLPELIRVAQIVAAETDSDMSAANIAFLLRCALQCRAEDIRFATMPNTPAELDGLSYTFVEPEEWLVMLNDMLDPLDAPITLDNLDVVYLRGGLPCRNGK